MAAVGDPATDTTHGGRPSPIPDEIQPGRRRGGLVAAIFAGALLVMLRPGPPSLSRSFTNLGDPVFLSWSLSWSSHALFHDPVHLFDAPIYWPHGLALARSESLLLLTLP